MLELTFLLVLVHIALSLPALPVASSHSSIHFYFKSMSSQEDFLIRTIVPNCFNTLQLEMLITSIMIKTAPNTLHQSKELKRM